MISSLRKTKHSLIEFFKTTAKLAYVAKKVFLFMI